MSRPYNVMLAFLFGISLLTATGLRAQVIDLRINGVDIGEKYSTIISKLHGPLYIGGRGRVPCGNAMRTLQYDGLILGLETGGIDPFGLYKVEVTSPKWSISGLHIGASRRSIVSKFGRGPYFIKDGFAHFYFRRNRLVKAQWEFNFC